jgi:asparagine synthase (glutamine-hydrolysing)
LLRHELVENTGLDERYAEWYTQQPDLAETQREQHYREITQAYQAHGFETMNKAAAAFHLEARCPLWDKRLVEFCLALPGDQKLHHGFGRYVMRRAMDSILPPEVQWRTSKTDFLPNFRRALLDGERERLAALLHDETQHIGDFVDRESLRAAYRRCLDDRSADSAEELFGIWRVACLSLWLRTRHTAEAVEDDRQFTLPARGGLVRLGAL